MKEEQLQNLSRALTHLVYRNTLVEDLHAMDAKLDDATMKLINKEVNNRIYTLLKWYTSENETEQKQVEDLVAFSSLYGKGSWDLAEELRLEDF